MNLAEQESWRAGWKGKVEATIILLKKYSPGKDIIALAIAGGPACDWERAELYSKVQKLHPEVKLKQLGDLEDLEHYLERMAARNGSSKLGESSARRAFTLLVVGECGDGKSTLVNALRDPAKSTEAHAGKSPRGVTKQIQRYDGTPINGHPITILDTPGIGDKDVTPAKLFALLEQELAAGGGEGWSRAARRLMGSS